jgi:branched-chain amino acid aminotransferase group I
MPNYIYLNGKFVNHEKATVSAADRGLLYGDGVFDTLRAYKGKVFKFREHLDRLTLGAHIVQIKLPPEKPLEKAVYDLLKKNKLKEAYIRITLTRGTGGKGLVPDPKGKPTVMIVAKKIIPYPPKAYKQGFKTATLKTRRNSTSPAAGIKSLNYLDNILGRLETEKTGYDEGIFINDKGFIACGTVSNIFYVRNDVVYTPPLSTGILPGITRRTVLTQLAGRVGVEVKEKSIRELDLPDYSEVFLTNTLMEIMPVRCIDSHFFKPGDITKRLQAGFKEIVKEATTG